MSSPMSKPIARTKWPDGAHKRVTIKVIYPTGRIEKSVFKTGPGKVYLEKHVQDLLDQGIEWLDKNCPTSEFRLVQVGPADYNFIYSGERTPPEIIIVESFSHPVAE